MLRKQKKNSRILQSAESANTAVSLSVGGFYSHEKPANSACHMLCMKPYDEDNDPTFPQFMRICGARILSSFPFVVEHIISHEGTDLNGEPFVTEYQKFGGKITCLDKSVLFASSEYDGPKILNLIPEDDLLYYEYHGYGCHQSLSKDIQKRRAVCPKESQFDVRICCHENHDYILFEMTGDPQFYINQLRAICAQETRELIYFESAK